MVETKLFVPRRRSDLVARPRLSEHLARGLAGGGGRLVLVSAPAGFGKTTLLGSWLTAPGMEARNVAWLSLDSTERAAPAFWTYVVTALDRVVPGVGTRVLGLLQTGREPSEDMLVELINELSVLPDEVTLVLDDYHLVDGPAIRSGMTFLVDHLPPQVCLVISTRADPALPLARLRARGELTELRAADLRFTRDEAAVYLNDSAHLQLAADDVAALEQRTEGWVAALQLAALSLRGRDDAQAFIAGFAGDDRFVVDYLVEEVLDRQPSEVRRFLLLTSVLDRLSGPLCDAVTGESTGSPMLERLDRANLFLVPLDDRRRWYRYHHLFGDLLRSRLPDEHADVAALHRRASAWHDENGDSVAAVRHALAAGDLDRAADLVELAVPELRRNRQEATLRQWIDQLPDSLVERRPVLAMGFVGALMANNEFDDVERRLARIEQTLKRRAPGAPELVVLDETERSRLPGGVELYRAALALLGGDPAATLDHARLAVDLAPTQDDLTRASAAALVGLASWTTGDLEGAHHGYTEAADGLRRLGYLSDVLGCTITLADIEATQGRLRLAQRTYESALDLAAVEPGMRGVRDMHTGLAQIAVERNDLLGATEHLGRADQLGEAGGLPQDPWRWRVAMALLRDAEGDHASALALLAEADRVYVGDFLPNVQPVSAMRARMLAEQGDVPAALDWARQVGVGADDDVSYLREYEHVTLARALLAQHAADGSRPVLAGAVGLLDRLLTAADDGGRQGTVVEVLSLLALAHHAAGDGDSALDALEQALRLAEPEGYVRTIAGVGGQMATLLESVTRRRPDWAYARRLLEVTGRPGPTLAQDRLVVPLTGRERDVLRLLASDLDGPAIARELVLSLNTVRTHTKNIYAKLGVANRRAAVTRAHQLSLLSRTERPPG